MCEHRLSPNYNFPPEVPRVAKRIRTNSPDIPVSKRIQVYTAGALYKIYKKYIQGVQLIYNTCNLYN